MTSRPATAQHLRDLARLRGVRDRIDREYAQPLDVEALARGAHMSAGHFSRQHTVVEDVSADLGRINVPVLVVAGEHDRVEPVEVMRSHVIAEIAGAELTIIPGSGHLIPLERPQALSDYIAAFRDTITRG